HPRDFSTGLRYEQPLFPYTTLFRSSLGRDPAAAARLNAWLKEIVIYLVENYRESLSQIVSDTIAEWDAGATAARIELYIGRDLRSEEHTSELQSRENLVCRLLLEKK